MKIFYFFLLLFCSFLSNSFATEKIVYLNMNQLIQQSEVGKYVNNELKKINDLNKKDLTKLENLIKSEDAKLIKQKSILKEEDFKLKLEELKLKYQSYQEKKIKKSKDLENLKVKSGNQILKVINEILGEYSSNESISLVIEKKNVVMGKTSLDITNDILELLNKKIKKIEVK